jgi:exonuclease SbcD
VRLVLAGDLHLGRLCTRLPAELDGRRFGAAKGWDRLVERTIAAGADALLLSGDLVDQSNRYFEALGPLAAGLARLAQAGVRVLAVSGNHDHDVLPRLAGDAGLTLLGAGGTWERFTLSDRTGRPALHVDGWSFPAARHPHDPLDDYPALPSGGLPLIGLLHADLDAPGSPYAPVRSARLASAGPHFWLLGHVHGPRYQAAGPVGLLYPGSPVPLDPGEPGAHGAWLLEVRPGGLPVPQLLPLAPVRYDEVEVSLDGLTDESAAEAAITGAVMRHLTELATAPQAPEVVSLRVRLGGRTSLHARLAQVAERARADFAPVVRETAAHLERVVVATRPAFDLEALARGSDPPATLARLINSLDDASSEEVAPWLEAARNGAETARAAKHYAEAGSAPALDDIALRESVREKAFALLERLLAQKESVA